jgi:SAM-dependent methyltransferase
MIASMPRISFRDPSGELYRTGNRVLRLVRPAGLADLELIERSNFAPRAQSEMRLIPHSRIIRQSLPEGFSGQEGTWIEHPRIPFSSFPEEWCWGMLHSAALLTLDLALEAETDGLELKDASPRNILFIGPNPCFIDLLSFRRPIAGVQGWLPLAAFLRGFLFPLALSAKFGLRLDRCFLPDHNGISHQETLELVGFRGSFRPPFWKWLRLPVLLDPLARRLELQSEATQSQPPGFLRSLLTSLRNEVSRQRPAISASIWSNYEKDRLYTDGALASKRTIVDQILASLATDSRVLDLGANTGEFSIMSGNRGFSTVALDKDPACVQRLFDHARSQNLPILPLVMDVSRPTPAQGWACSEQPSFLERAEGQFDLVLALALIHHLRFPAGVPLRLQMEQVARFTRRWALVEWIPETDPQVTAFIKRFHYLPDDYHLAGFEAALDSSFKTVARMPLEESGRVLYLLERPE